MEDSHLNMLTRQQAASGSASKDAQKKKEEAAPEVTPLDKMLLSAGALRQDGSDKFFGMENVSFTPHIFSLSYREDADVHHVVW